MNIGSGIQLHSFQDLQLYREPIKGILNIGHRGACAYYPENTMSSFRAALEMQADVIELDVQLTKDGIPIVIHDFTVTRTTDGRGNVADLTYAEIKQMDAGSWLSPDFKGEYIPSLEEVLKFAKGRINLNIEIKANPGSPRGETEARTLTLVRKYEMTKHVFFSSFDIDSLKQLRKMDSNLIIGLLYENSWRRNIKPLSVIENLQADAFHCSKSGIKKKWIQQLNKNYIPVFIYTVNAKSTMNKLIEWGINGIFTNKPNVLRNVLIGD